LSGMVFMGLGYWYATPRAQRPQPDLSVGPVKTA
ncbi:nitrite transporter NirC, partial [Escherichia coli]|nr:nitrite transporter NirC [Escherichia coli]